MDAARGDSHGNRQGLAAGDRAQPLGQWRRAGREAPLDEAIAEPAASPDDAAAARIELERAVRAIRALPEGERVALMRAHGGLSYDEIAGALAISPPAAKVRVHRARLKLAAMCQRQPSRSP